MRVTERAVVEEGRVQIALIVESVGSKRSDERLVHGGGESLNVGNVVLVSNACRVERLHLGEPLPQPEDTLHKLVSRLAEAERRAKATLKFVTFRDERATLCVIKDNKGSILNEVNVHD
jgi:hypothetical protein